MARIQLPTFILAASFPIVIFAACMIILFERQRTEAVQSDLALVNAAMLTAVDERVLVVRVALNILGSSAMVAMADRDGFDAQAQRTLALNPDWVGLQLTSRTGSLSAGREGSAVPDWMAGEVADVFRYGKAEISGILVDPERRSDPVFSVSVPIFGENGIQHVLSAHVRAWVLNRALRDRGIPSGWRGAVLDADGRIIARTRSDDPWDPVIGTFPHSTLLEGLRSGQSLFFSTTSLNDTLYTTVATSLETGWTVAIGAPSALVQQSSRVARSAVIGGGIAALSMTLAIAWLLTRAYAKRQAAERRVLQLEAVQTLKARTSVILESTTDCVFELDADWHVVFINRRARDLLVEGADPTGRVFWDVLPRAKQTGFWHNCNRVATEHIPIEFEEFFPPLNAWYFLRAFPTHDGGVAVYFQDITERRQARDALAESELRYRFLAESTPQIIWTAEPDGSIDYIGGRFADYASAGDGEQIKGWGWRTLVHPDDEEATVKAWEQARAAGQTFEVEYRVRRHDGMYRWHLARAMPMLDEFSRAVKWFGTATDIHEQKLLQEELRAARDEAEQANLAKSRFLAATSHDLRQPMQSLFLFAEALERHVPDGRGAEMLMHLRRGLDALKVLLDGLLDVSRLDADAVQPTIEDFPVSQLLEPVGAAFAKVAAAKQLDFEIKACDTPIRSDRKLLTRILNNLLENAVRYTETGRVRVECRTMDTLVRIEVQDTGIGIPQEHLEHIWTEFHQVGNPERDRNQGLGLGLAIVQRLARLLDHPVGVWSATGRGSIFSIDVPVGTASAGAVQPAMSAVPSAAPQLPNPAPSMSKPRYAVLVDDDAIVLLGLQAILKEWGYDVLAAGSTDQAVERLRGTSQPPDIVVADYRLREGRFGTEAILRIRELFGGSEIPGVILTGETGPECARDAAMHGLTVAHKPITARQLRSAVEKLLADAAE